MGKEIFIMLNERPGRVPWDRHQRALLELRRFDELLRDTVKGQPMTLESRATDTGFEQRQLPVRECWIQPILSVRKKHFDLFSNICHISQLLKTPPYPHTKTNERPQSVNINQTS